MLLFVLGAGAVGWLAGQSLRNGRRIGDDRLGQVPEVYQDRPPGWGGADEAARARYAQYARMALRLQREVPLVFTTRETPARYTAAEWIRRYPSPSQEIYRQMQAHPSKLRPRRTLPMIPTLPGGGGAIPFQGY